MTTPAPDAPPAPAPAPEPPAAPAAGFPENTPLDQMTVEQRENYWKHQSRKHEDRVKAFGGLTTDELTELRTKAEKHDALELELSSEAEKAAAKAAKEAETKVRSEMQPKLVETAFRMAIGDRKTPEEISEFIADTNLARFLTDTGDVDTAKVSARVTEFAPVTGTPAPQRIGPSPSGQGTLPPVETKKGDPARAWLAKKGITVD